MTQFHFVHIPKNGGMTIRRCPELKSMVSVSGPQFHKSPQYTQALNAQMKKHHEHHGNEHARWRDLSAAAQSKKCFAVVRNPWSKVVSRYTFLMNHFTPEHKKYNVMMAHPTYEPKPFEEFLDERLTWGGMEYFWHRAIRGWFTQKDHVTDEQGNIKCDILRLENLDADLRKYFNINMNFQTRNVSNIAKKDYKSFYTPETKKIVEDWYQDDIETFGFTFEGGATKNTVYGE